ncbi:MAG: PilX N-terminal domain-containing pilus assembly protein [Gammaproteobacteria bacterium]|nr:PilX N-terminal domain-containing pilus assembly protein [Gammaproteobacteria bacterium]
MNHLTHQHFHNQSGSVLIISLIVMLILTILGVSGMKSSVLEEKMAGNMRDGQLAFQAAEATLREAEQYIEGNVVSIANFDTDGSDGLYDKSQQNLWDSIGWTSGDSLEFSDFNTGYAVNTPPRYIIEHLASQQNNVDTLNMDNYGQGTGAGRIEMFLITARATGSSGNTVVMLQSTYGKRL